MTATVEAPIAVRTFDVDAPADLDLTPRGAPAYRGALVVLRRADRPVGTLMVEVSDGHVPAATVSALAERRLGAMPAGAPAPPTTGPAATVVVTTCDRPGPLEECLAALTAMTYRSFDVVVVENRPRPGASTAAVVARFGERVRYLEEPVAGLSRARNAGLAAATGEVVAFTDDDVVPDPGWLAALVHGFAAAPDVAAVTGLILPRSLETRAQMLVEQFAAFGKGFAPATHRLAAGRAANPMFPYTAGELGSGANMAFRADVLRAVDGYDEALGAGTPTRGGEDLDILVRLLLDGHAVRYEPGAVVWHEHPDTMPRLRTQARSYGRGVSAMVGKHALLGDERGYVLRQAPRGVRYLLDAGSRKNRQKGPDFPRSLVWLERAAMVGGPATYLRSRRRTRRAAATATFRPTWVTEVDLDAPAVDLVPPDRDGAPYARVRALVRLHREPLGFVERELADGRLSGAAVRRAVEHDLGDALREHLVGDGLPTAPLGRRPVRTPRLPACAAPGPYGTAEPSVTVVVCTRDRAPSLRATLTTLLAVDYPHFDVVVVDNAPRTDASQRVVEELGDPRVRLVLEPRPGLSRARNRGVAEAQGEVVAFTDDDVLVDRWWLRGLVRGFTRARDVGCVTGMVPTAELETAAQAYFDMKVGWAAVTSPRLYDLGAHRLEEPLYPYLAGTFGAGANFAVSRAAIERIGPFDEALGAGSPAAGGEDLDFFLRTILSGATLAVEPSSIVWHVHRRELGALRGQMGGYGAGLSAFAVKHLLDRGTALDILRRTPAALRRMRRLQERTPAAVTPPGLRAAELRGFAAGPARYLRGRRAAARSG